MPQKETLVKNFFTLLSSLLTRPKVINFVRYPARAPTLWEMNISLSFRTTRRSLPRCPALLRASKAIPPVIEPSPITATTLWLLLPDKSRAQAIPRAAEIAVELCPTPKASYSLSLGVGKPLIPPCWRRVEKLSLLPVRILWV